MTEVTRLPIFTQEVFYFQLENLDFWQKKINEIIAIEEKIFKTVPDRQCNVFAKRTDWNSHERYESLGDLGQNIRESLEDFIEKEGYDIPELALHECWINWYNKDDHAVPHKHDNFLAVVLFLDVENSDSYFYVHADVNAVLQKKDEQNTISNKIKQINIKDGTVLFFDGKVTHSVSANKSERTRITVAFNFRPLYEVKRN